MIPFPIDYKPVGLQSILDEYSKDVKIEVEDRTIVERNTCVNAYYRESPLHIFPQESKIVSALGLPVFFKNNGIETAAYSLYGYNSCHCHAYSKVYCYQTSLPMSDTDDPGVLFLGGDYGLVALPLCPSDMGVSSYMAFLYITDFDTIPTKLKQALELNI